MAGTFLSAAMTTGGGPGPGSGACAGPRYDYVLVAGPGRSGSTFLWRLLAAHPAFTAPRIKEGYYYRSARRYRRARRGLGGAMLLDAANTAWADPRLDRLPASERRVLLVVLLRRHRDRAVSVMAYRKSRALPDAWAGGGALEQRALGESLTAEALERLFGLGADLLAVGFETLTAEPQLVLDTLSRLCGVPPVAAPALAPANAAERARHPLLGGAAKLAALALRFAGAHRLLQALKDSPRMRGLFFRPLEDRPRLSAEAEALLDRQYGDCVAALDGAGERLGAGLWYVGARAADGGTMETEGMDAAADADGEAGERGFFFQIGFQRCGTTSIAAFFNRCGIPCVHHDQGRLARRMRVNMEAGAQPLAGYDERYRAFTNINWSAADDYYDGFKHFAALRRAYGGRFILNTRPVENWVRSVMSHKALRGRRHVESHYALRFGTTDPDEVAARWREEWEEHCRRVLAEIPMDELLVFDIESDPPERLCDFAGVPHECARFWTRENATLNPLGTVISRSVPLALKRRIPTPVKRPFKNLLAR